MNRCMCEAPPFVNIPGEHGWKTTYLLRGFDTLHFKKSDRICFRCGRGLCEKCRVPFPYSPSGRKFKSGDIVWYHFDYCAVCKEYVK